MKTSQLSDMVISTVSTPSKTPTATKDASTNGGVNLDLLSSEITAAFPGRQIWSKNITGYGATISVSFQDGLLGTELATLTTVVANHNPNALTPDQQAVIDENTELTAIPANIDAMTADVSAINNPAGLKDQINNATTGLKAQINNTAWTPLTTAQKVELLRTVVQAILQILIGILNILVDLSKATKSLLKIAKYNAKV